MNLGSTNPSMRSVIIVVGGGFFGMYLAEYLSRRGARVILCEKAEKLMKRASYNNQARVHNGYHYPRSILTAMRSHHSFPRFADEFAECIDSSFDNYYLVGRILSKVTANQFQHFCERIGLECRDAPADIKNLTSSKWIEAVFSTVEFTFDADKIGQQMYSRLESSGVEIRTNCVVKSVRQAPNGVEVELADATDELASEFVSARHVFNCTYSMTNSLVVNSRLDSIPLKHELTEICLVEMPEILRRVGLTVMCGPFFSVMPFPSRSLHSFSHVRYTPHFHWHDDDTQEYRDAYSQLDRYPKRTNWQSIVCDARRYLPILNDCTYRESLWEVKTVLPQSEVDDSRPILFRPNYGIPGFHCVLGGKIDNVYDVIELIEQRALVG